MNKQEYTVQKIATLVNAKLIGEGRKDIIQHLVFDSRKIESPLDSLFFALKGHRDGQSFIQDAYLEGIRCFMVSSLPSLLHADATYLLVEDVLAALQRLAEIHRKHFAYPVVGITGSNGKTVIKEWLYQLLNAHYSIVRSPKSYNSQIGVPLSIWQMEERNTLALIEAGISKPNEMEKLNKIIQPTIGILSNIKQAHRDNFRSEEELIQEKLKLFKGVSLLIYSPQYVKREFIEALGCETFTWGYSKGCDLQILKSTPIDGGGSSLAARYKEKNYTLRIPFSDEASIENASICWAFLLNLGLSDSEIKAGMEQLSAVKMRLELKTGQNNNSIIDDSYNCDVSSLSIALDFLKQQNQHPKRTLILSDIPEIENDKDAVYSRVASLIKTKGVDNLIGIGEDMVKYASVFSFGGKFFLTTQDFLNHLKEFPLYGQTILIKGARKFQFEKISKALSAKAHKTVLEINLNALEHNLNQFKSHLKPATKIMVMVKAFSYGSGSFEIANLLQFNQVDYLAVAYADEGVALRNAGITLPIMVMSPDLSDMQTLLDNNLEPEIFSMEQLEGFRDVLKKNKVINYPIHLKVDSGMHRLGFLLKEVPAVIDRLTKGREMQVKSVFSHFAAADDPVQDEFTLGQIKYLSEFTSLIKKGVGYEFMSHIANTAGMIRFPEAQMDMVRLGIGLYGIKSDSYTNLPLIPVATLKTVVAQVKKLAATETVGYGRQGKLSRDTEVATVKIGYADGYDRRYGNGKGKMWVKNTLVPTLGNICMDMSMLDVTGLNISAGDEVIVFGADYPIEDLAKSISTIPYEVATGISTRVKRIYYFE